MDCIIRKATIEDIPGLDQVMQVISDGPGDPAIMERLIRKISADSDKYLLVAVNQENDEIMGSLLGVIFEDICGDGRPILLVENVAVLEQYQGKGVGRRMFEEVERWGREKDCHYEMLVSGLSRTGAHQFYSALEFEEVKGFKKYL